MTDTAPPEPHRDELRRLRTHYQFSHAPFSKYGWAEHMYDSTSQKELLHALMLWLEVRGIALVTGPPGVGKSITLRRFVRRMDAARFRVVDFTGYLPSTVHGFLRSLNRKLELAPRGHSADLFDQIQQHLAATQAETDAHTILVVDDAEGLRTPTVDAIRRLTAYKLDAEALISIVFAGTDDLLKVLRDAVLQPLVSRIVYTQQLRPFGLEDTRNYIHHHLERADVSTKLFTDDAVRRIFNASQGKPRSINQLAIQAMIQAVVVGRDQIDGDFLDRLLQQHPFYSSPRSKR
jgi:type II secretory pathway predicted ATPase ExeA